MVKTTEKFQKGGYPLRSIGQFIKNQYRIRPLVWHILCFALGIVISYHRTLPQSTLFLWGMPLLLLAALCLWRRFYAGILLFMLFVGICWGQSRLLDQDYLVFYAGTELRVTAMVTSVPEVTAKGGLSFYCRTDTINGQTGTAKKFLVYADGADAAIQYGDVILFYGQPYFAKEYYNPGYFNYDRYLTTQGISGRLQVNGQILTSGENHGNWLVKVVHACRAVVLAALARLPAQEAGMVEGILLGDKSGLDEAATNALSHTGLFHAFSVSGLHLGFVLAFVLWITNRLRMKGWPQAILALAVLLFYAALADFSPPVMRALIMAVIGLLAYLLGERKDYYTALAVAMGCSLLYQPDSVANIGFQLSYIAAFGMVYLGPFFRQILPGRGSVKQAFRITLAAQLAVMPLIAYYFNVATLAALLYSPLICFLVGIVVILGLVAILLTPLGAAVAVIPFYAAGFVSDFILQTVTVVDRLVLAWVPVCISGLWVLVVYYTCFLALPITLRIPSKKITPYAAMVCLLCLLFIPGKQSIMYPLQVYYLDVGEGDAALIKTPEETTILIDGGGGTAKNIGEKVLVPFLQKMGVAKLDMIINTHPHADHTDGLFTVLDEIPVGVLFCSPTFESVKMQNELAAQALQKGTRIVYLGTGSYLALGNGLSMRVLAPAKDAVSSKNDLNEECLALKLSYYDIDFLWLGDRQKSGLNDLAAADLAAEVLLLPHHGSDGSFGEVFYREVNPQDVVISVGRDNSYGHPGQEAISYFAEKGIAVYRTDLNGMVQIQTDGFSLQVETFR